MSSGLLLRPICADAGSNVTPFKHPRYFKRRENNGFYTLMPLRGPYRSDALMVNDFTYRVLEYHEAGKTLEAILDILQHEYPEENEQKIRADLFHAAARLKKYDFIDTGGFVEYARILRNSRKLVLRSLQPCPVGHIPALARLLSTAGTEGQGQWLYNVFSLGSQQDPATMYEAERMVEAQVTGSETFWVYVDQHEQLIGGVTSSNYMLMSPTVSVTAIAVASPQEKLAEHSTVILSQLIELLSLFGLNEKLRLISCPVTAAAEQNATIFDQALFTAMAQCQFRKVASFAGELADNSIVEYYDRLL